MSSKVKLLGLGGVKCARVKSMGELGVRDLSCFNRTLIKNWIWRFLNQPNRLWLRVITSRYGTVVSLGGGDKNGNMDYVGRGSGRRGKIPGWWKDICELY